MNKTPSEARSFVREFVTSMPRNARTPTVILAPFPALASVAAELVLTDKVSLGAQNLHFEPKGAFTGEVSAPMLVDCRCRYVIVGHSERRSLFGEEDELLNRKVRAALAHGLIPILCVGETLQERDAGQLEDVLTSQLKADLIGIGTDNIEGMVLAYEPVWAIGTGRTATPDQAQEAHRFIRTVLADTLKVDAKRVPILYGGSVTPENAYSLLSQKDIDGALVGGASLKVESLLALLAAADRAVQEKG